MRLIELYLPYKTYKPVPKEKSKSTGFVRNDSNLHCFQCFQEYFWVQQDMNYAPVICNQVPPRAWDSGGIVGLKCHALPWRCPGSAWICWAFDFRQNSGGNSDAFLPGYSAVF